MASLDGLLKVILYVRDMELQVHFYRDQLGLAVKNPQNVRDFSREYWVELDTGPCTLVLHGGGQGRIGKDSPKVAFGVGNIQAVRDQLLRSGVPLGEIRSPAPGVYVCDGVDPEGNNFSIDYHEH